MSIASNLYRQTLIAESNRAELDIMRANSAQRTLSGSNSKDLAAVAKKEAQIQQQKLQAEVKKKAADAQLKSMKDKKNKNKMHKLDVMA